MNIEKNNKYLESKPVISPGFHVNTNLSNKNVNFKLNSIMNSGSPMSLIIYCLVKDKVEVNEVVNENFTGIHNSKFKIIGIYELNIRINNIIFQGSRYWFRD